MASLLVDGGKQLVCAGQTIVCLQDLSLDNSTILRPFFNENPQQNGGGVDDDVKKQDGGGVPKRDGPKEKDTNLACMGLSACGQYLAVCGENKRLVVYHNMRKICETILTRKATKIIFTKDGSNLVLADKNGDVYSFAFRDAVEETKPNLVLGHLSMLLDFQLSSSNRHIITADRDEKIRVSNYPASYNINNFCLGHTDFVSSISFCDEAHLLSGSGDGTLRLWNFLEGKELAVREVYKDVEVKLDRTAAEKREARSSHFGNKSSADNGHDAAADKDHKAEADNGHDAAVENVHEAAEDNRRVDKASSDLKELGLERRRNEPSDIPAVIKINCLVDASEALVQLEGLNGLLLYSVDKESNNLVKKEILQFEETLVDFDTDGASKLTCLTLRRSNQASLKQYSLQDGTFSLVARVELPGQLVDIKEEQIGDLSNLHKRWFDNMKEYLERKQIRVENTRRKQEEVPEKRRKIETAAAAT